jgi:peroxiredoxin (alkyl hydroperoxide reductase subunit C)
MLEDRDEFYFEELKIGHEMPDFEMDTYDPVKKQFGKFKLSDNISAKKWTVLVFYPADYTFVCPTELKDLGDVYDDIKKIGDIDVVSVSCDTHFVHLAWQNSEKLLKDIKYPMAADPTGNVARLFGVYDEESGLALRGTFIINPEGILSGSEITYYNVGRNASELLRKLKAYIHVYNNPNEACPANWEQGGKTLKPDEDLVGKVGESLGG